MDQTCTCTFLPPSRDPAEPHIQFPPEGELDPGCPVHGTPWWEDLTPEQTERLGGLIDSRVRLLGESYGRATEQVRHHSSQENIDWVLGERSKP